MNDLPTILNRRAFLGAAGNSFGAVALTSMLARGDSDTVPHPAFRLAPKAKHVIYMFQSGGPSHVDLFDGSPFLSSRTTGSTSLPRSRASSGSLA